MTKAECHPDKKYGARGMCQICYNAWLRKINPAYAKACKDSTARYGRTPKATAQRLNLTLLKRYGITAPEREQIAKKQNYLCLLCQQSKKLVVEHCHRTKLFRGLTCHKCNILIGQVENNIDLLPKVFQYLNIKNLELIVTLKTGEK